jgi:hypothetical protein
VPAGRQQVGQRKDATKDAQTVAKANKKATLSGGFSCDQGRSNLDEL